MKTKLLLPHRYKSLGWFILIPSTILGLVLCYNEFSAEWIHANVFAIATDAPFGKYQYFTATYTNITNTVIGSLFIIGALMVSFSKEKNEDEFIAELRLSSLLWAVCVSYILLLLAFLFVYGTPFLDVMVYNMFTVPIIFIVRFNYILIRNAKTIPDEK
ncbi:MAG: hypothetical protein IPP31_07420 [Chitinophagaceae bacterium]|nr:hypothetical protein [Chitinophagaceae bacterium]